MALSVIDHGPIFLKTSYFCFCRFALGDPGGGFPQGRWGETLRMLPNFSPALQFECHPFFFRGSFSQASFPFPQYM